MNYDTRVAKVHGRNSQIDGAAFPNYPWKTLILEIVWRRGVAKKSG